MPARLCPHCGSPAPENVTRCPQCRQPLGGSPSPTASVAEELRAEMSGPELLGWGTVRAGLGLVEFGALVLALAVVSLSGFALLFRKELAQNAGTEGLYVGPGLVLFGAGILALAGSCMGVAVPARSGARGWAIGYCVLLALLIVLLGVIAAEGDFESILGEPAGLRAGDKAQRASPWHAEPPLQADDRTSGKNLLRRFLWFDVHLVAGLASACFALFLVNIADFFSHRRLERNARIFLIFAVVLNLLTIAVGPLQTTSAAALPAVRWVVLGLLVLVCAWLTVLARRVREMVTRGMTA